MRKLQFVKKEQKRKKMEILKKVSVVACTGALVLSSILGNTKVSLASTEGTYYYKGNTAEMVADVKTNKRAYFSIYYPVKTTLSAEGQLYVMSDKGDGYIRANNKEIESGSLATTMIATSFNLDSEYQNAGKKIEKIQVRGKVSGSTFKNDKTGKTYVEDYR